MLIITSIFSPIVDSNGFQIKGEPLNDEETKGAGQNQSMNLPSMVLDKGDSNGALRRLPKRKRSKDKQSLEKTIFNDAGGNHIS